MIQSIPTNSGVAPGGAVGGASNLTTVGAIPYVSASGVLNQDGTNLFWDATNHRLGVGTASPNAQVELFTSGSSASIIRVGNSNGASQFGANATGATVVRNESAAQLISFQLNAEIARFAATSGNLLIGGTTDGNYKLEVANSGSSGTLRIYDQTATTGNTKEVIRAGAGQSTNLTEWQNNAGSVLAYVGNTGGVVGEAVYGKTIKNSPAGVAFAFHDGAYSTAGGYFQSTFPLVWNSDAGFKRSAAGYMAVTDGSTGLGKIVVSQSTPSASTDAGTAGAIWADANYIYVQTAGSTIKRIALTTF